MAEQASFIGSVQHTPDTIQRLYKTEYYTYDTLRILSRFLFGGALIAAALILELPRPVQILLLLVGCWLIISKDFPARYRSWTTVRRPSLCTSAPSSRTGWSCPARGP